MQMKKHGSLDVPPDKPFWRMKKGKETKRDQGAASIPPSSVSSPGKRIELRGKLVDQLLKWHQLVEKGGITQEQYDQLQLTIMSDVNKF